LKRLSPCAALLLVLLAGWTVEALAEGGAARLADPVALGRAFATIAQKVTPAVVNISATRIIPGRRSPLADDPFFRQFFGDDFPFGDLFAEPDRQAQSLGSGVIVSADGTVVTNNHVVERADAIRVSLADGRQLDARLVGVDPDTDIAVLTVDATGLPCAQWGDSDALQVGEWVIAIGSPFGLSQTVTAGIVSAKGRTDMGISGYEDFIQTDAAINPGNSGGALVSMDGELVGINTAILSETGGYQGIGFAVPSAIAKPVVETLLRDGKIVRAWLGVIVTPVADASGNPAGVVITNMYRDSPAHRGGLLPGDIIVQVAGKRVESPAQLRNMVKRMQIGASVDVDVLRQGERLRARCTLMEHPVGRTGRPVAGI
jgi:serine protease Do